jgi:MraZ protein
LLIGEYEHSLDTKGRLILPAKLREDIGEKFIITKGLDSCLFGFSKTEWNNFEDKLKTLPLTNKNARDFVRFFLSGAIEAELDKQGRFLIPSNLREYATLDKEAVITGVGTRIEIWDKTKWKAYNSEENLSADQIAENMANLGMLGI